MITVAGLSEINEALDALGIALADHQHQWSQKERELYEKSKTTIFLEQTWLADALAHNKCPYCGRKGIVTSSS